MNNNITSTSDLTSNIWLDVKSDIELKILTGAYVAGERIPSIRKLAVDYGVGQSTVQKVLNVLWYEGVIEPKRGVGFFVKPYIREQLISKRRITIEKQIKNILEEALLINMDVKPIFDMCLDSNNRSETY